MRPTSGMPVRPGRSRCPAGVMRSPVKRAPISPDNPVPRMVSARPEATWLTARPRVIIAKTSDSNIPASTPAMAPTMTEPDNQAPAKPHAAPTIIMPSTPRLRTPDRSFTNSPVAAINSGVDAASTDRMMASASSTGHLPGCEDEPEAVEDQGIAGEHVEQQDALEHLGDVQRNFHRDLGLFAADKSEREEKACN